jgi:hypothetical protein
MRGEQMDNVKTSVLTAVNMKMAVVCVVEPCSLVEVYRRFRGTCCLHHQGDCLGGLAFNVTLTFLAILFA